MNNHRVDRSGSDQSEYSLEGWPVRVCTGAPLIIETFANHVQLEAVTLLAPQEMKAEFPLHIAGGEIAFSFHRLPCVDGAVEQPGFVVASQSPSYAPMLSRFAGKCEVVRVGPDIVSSVLINRCRLLQAKPRETAFGKAGEG